MSRSKSSLFAPAAALLAAFGVLAPVASGTGASWSSKTPDPSSFHVEACAAISGTIYVYAATGGVGSAMLAYDPAADSWSTRTLPPSPTRRASPAYGVIGGRLYLAGGAVDGDENSQTGRVDVYNPATDSWSSAASMITPRSLTAYGVVDGKLYVIGGHSCSSCSAVGTVEVYDPATNSWAAAASMPDPRESLNAAATVDGLIYVAGGTATSPTASFTTTLQIYDPASDSWTDGADLPAARNYAPSIGIGGHVYVVGGLDESGYLSSVLSYDPVADSWATEPSMPTARLGSQLVHLGDALYAIGGSTADGSSPNEVLAPVAVEPPAGTALTALAPAEVWLGLKNSDDVGTKFDLLVEVLVNGSVVGSGEADGLSGGSSGFSNAIQRQVGLSLASSVDLASGDGVGVRISVRVAATGHKSGTARLWYGDSGADSRFGATIAESSDAYYLVGPTTALALNQGSTGGTRRSIDVTVNRNVGGNPFKAFGTWTYAVP